MKHEANLTVTCLLVVPKCLYMWIKFSLNPFILFFLNSDVLVSYSRIKLVLFGFVIVSFNKHVS